jgi:c(7)-type cytochrome triheme protein
MIRIACALAAAVVLAIAAAQAGAGDLGDVKFARTVPGTEQIPPAVFPHSMHRIAYKCGACHDSLFPMKAGSAKITMDAIQEGHSCGTCHNGELAFASTFATCALCHKD